jgi:peptide/nickel transport system substrate-binding protein
MKPDIRWQLLLASAGLALVVMLVSYQVQSAALCMVSLPAAGGTFVEGIVGRPVSLNPLLADPYPVDRELVNLIFDGLVRRDENGQIAPALAEEWSISDDGLSLTFTLRDGLTWHDGQPVTSSDVAFTYGLLQDEDFLGPPGLVELWNSVQIEQIDDRNIRFTLTQPFAPFLESTTRGILPAHLLANIDVTELAATQFTDAPNGTGPFMVQPGQDWQTTGRLRLTPNPNYWVDGTQITDIEFRFFPDAQSLLAAFFAGEIHGMNSLSPTLTPQVTAQDNTRLFTSIAPRYTALFFNLSESGAIPIKTKEVRQALAFGIDREVLVDRALNGQGIVFEGPYLPGTRYYRPDLLTTYTYQPETAAELLNTAGWVGEGIRSRENVPLSLRLVSADSEESQSVAEELVRQWGAIGIDVQLDLRSDSADLRRALEERSYDIALVEVLPPGDPDLYDFWSRKPRCVAITIRVGTTGEQARRWKRAGSFISLKNGRHTMRRSFDSSTQICRPSLFIST